MENHLRQWNPRQPSADVRHKIFVVRAQAAGFHFAASDLMRWLIPVMGCLALVLSGVNIHTSNGRMMLASTNLMLGNFNANNAPLESSFNARPTHSEQNNVVSARVEWSIGLPAQAEASHSSNLFDTNHLSQ